MHKLTRYMKLHAHQQNLIKQPRYFDNGLFKPKKTDKFMFKSSLETREIFRSEEKIKTKEI